MAALRTRLNLIPKRIALWVAKLCSWRPVANVVHLVLVNAVSTNRGGAGASRRGKILTRSSIMGHTPIAGAVPRPVPDRDGRIDLLTAPEAMIMFWSTGNPLQVCLQSANLFPKVWRCTNSYCLGQHIPFEHSHRQHNCLYKIESHSRKYRTEYLVHPSLFDHQLAGDQLRLTANKPAAAMRPWLDRCHSAGSGPQESTGKDPVVGTDISKIPRAKFPLIFWFR